MTDIPRKGPGLDRPLVVQGKGDDIERLRSALHEHPDEQVEHPDEGRDAPLSVNEIKIAINARANDAATRLDALRKQRDAFNVGVKTQRAELERQIKKAVAELAEAKRIANALKPRTRAKKATAK